MAKSELQRLIETLGTETGAIIREYTEKELKPLRERIAELEAGMAIVTEKGLLYRGVWQAAEEYQRGNMATLKGALWHCNAATRERPGSGSDWTMAVKAGGE